MKLPQGRLVLLIAAAALAVAGCNLLPGKANELGIDKDRFEAALDPAVGGPDTCVVIKDTASGAELAWTTTVPASGQVLLGTSPTGLSAVAPTQVAADLNHHQTLTGLAPNGTYYLQIRATSVGGTSTLSPLLTIHTQPLLVTSAGLSPQRTTASASWSSGTTSPQGTSSVRTSAPQREAISTSRCPKRPSTGTSTRSPGSSSDTSTSSIPARAVPSTRNVASLPVWNTRR